MRALFLAAALAAFTSLGANAQTSPLAPMEFFKGCWHGAFAGSTTVTDERCFAPMLGGAYVRDTHVIHGAPAPYGGEAIYAYDAQAHRIGVTYYASDGGIERGFADPTGQGLSFPQSDFVGADGTVTTLRATWTPDGPDRFIAVAEFLENGRWVEHLHITYTRAPNVSPPAQ
jgi:hypothetical protein